MLFNTYFMIPSEDVGDDGDVVDTDGPTNMDTSRMELFRLNADSTSLSIDVVLLIV